MSKLPLAVLPPHDTHDKKGLARLLHEQEVVIERGLETFVEVGRALAEINNSKLYLATHETFEDYVRERWRWSRQQAYRQIAAAATSDALTPIGVTPKNEGQARAIAPLVAKNPEEAATVLKKLGPQATAAAITEAVAKRLPKPPKASKPKPLTQAIRQTQRAADQLLKALRSLAARGVAAAVKPLIEAVVGLSPALQALAARQAPAAVEPPRQVTTRGSLIHGEERELSQQAFAALEKQHGVTATDKPADTTTLRCRTCGTTWTAELPWYQLKAARHWRCPNPKCAALKRRGAKAAMKKTLAKK